MKLFGLSRQASSSQQESGSFYDLLFEKVEKLGEIPDSAWPTLSARPSIILLLLLVLCRSHSAEASTSCFWIVGSSGGSCDAACAAHSKLCDPVCQDQTHTDAERNAVLAAAGGFPTAPTCATWTDRGDTTQAVPGYFYGSNTCIFSSTKSSTCAAAGFSVARLCACIDSPTPTPSVAPTLQPTETPTLQPTSSPVALPSSLPTTNQSNGPKEEKMKERKTTKEPKISLTKVPKAPKEKVSKTPKQEKVSKVPKQAKEKQTKNEQRKQHSKLV